MMDNLFNFIIVFCFSLVVYVYSYLMISEFIEERRKRIARENKDELDHDTLTKIIKNGSFCMYEGSGCYSVYKLERTLYSDKFPEGIKYK